MESGSCESKSDGFFPSPHHFLNQDLGISAPAENQTQPLVSVQSYEGCYCPQVGRRRPAASTDEPDNWYIDATSVGRVPLFHSPQYLTGLVTPKLQEALPWRTNRGRDRVFFYPGSEACFFRKECYNTSAVSKLLFVLPETILVPSSIG